MQFNIYTFPLLAKKIWLIYQEDGVLYDHMEFYVLKTLWSNGKSDPNLLSKSGHCGLDEFSARSEAPPIIIFF